ncbi:gliding motility protein GldB-related protein [Roseivirga misakiensis]|uniref:Gliding motility lipoprotein GldB n=1 Tax=Roseivirga misakiensis TaxID=1563681 RepID=A0A1E5T6F9_9BACT|nr:hypothetical protein [Roseivirga misakiensis]OEK06965.1 hypothetical protein BFP71_04725 [Roseivirga misakiensis]
MLKRFCFLILLLGFLSCSDNDPCDGNVDISDVEIQLSVENLTHEIHGIQTMDALVEFLNAHPIIKDVFFEFGGRPSENQVLINLQNLIQEKEFGSLFRAKSYDEFDKILDNDRSLRQFVTYGYLSNNPGKSLKDVYDIFSGSNLPNIPVTESTGTSTLLNYLSSNLTEQNYFYSLFEYRSEEKLFEDNLALLQNPSIDTLYQETIDLIDMGVVSYELDRAYARIQQYYPDFKLPKVKAVYSGFGSDFHFSDTLVVIGLDYYLGEEASYRPNVYDYLRTRLTPAHLVPQLIQFTSFKFNSAKEGKRTVLEEMISYGKALEFAKEMLPCVADSIIMGYTPQQLANATVSEGIIWSHFLDKRLLYSDNPSNIKKYVDERPFVPEIDKLCPGRIGQWLGWQIVKAYREETEVGFVELMAETDAQKILTQSKYRPRYR